ncbi:unnamed protein product [Spirodela intermedia]|uniref:Uncharacterized protein n=2 Tax=Spirodela intermedia TaxID=51605 RepID=A0A7I8ICA9_SPIIN|nr:unnamed protein product [Spirodela intermedia]CAA6655396.1 unnamed protein product [Spirodela intermedia]
MARKGIDWEGGTREGSGERRSTRPCLFFLFLFLLSVGIRKREHHWRLLNSGPDCKSTPAAQVNG